MSINHKLTTLGIAAGLSLSSGPATPIATQQEKVTWSNYRRSS